MFVNLLLKASCGQLKSPPIKPSMSLLFDFRLMKFVKRCWGTWFCGWLYTLSSFMVLEPGGVARMPTDSNPTDDSVIVGASSISQVLGTAIAAPPAVESPVCLSDRVNEKPGRKKSTPLWSLVSFSIKIMALYVFFSLSSKYMMFALLFLRLLALMVIIPIFMWGMVVQEMSSGVG